MSLDLLYNIEEILCASEDFEVEIKPLLILEGKTDEDTYYKVLDKAKIDMNELEIILANGKTNIIKFYNRYKDKIKYVAILDTDHSHRNNSKIEDKNLLYTHFYDMENYLTSIDVVYSTYEDFKDVKTLKLSKEELLKKMAIIAYPSLLVTEYKLSYIEKESIKATIYSISDIIKIKDTRLNLDKLEDIEDIVRERIKYFISKSIDFDIDLWNTVVKEVKENIKNKSIQELDKYIQNMIKGRRLLEIYEVLFNNILGLKMKYRKGDIFIADLRKNIFNSKECILLVNNLEYSLNNIINN